MRNKPNSRVAIIGCGAIAEKAHIPAILINKHKISLICDIDKTRGKAFANKYNCIFSDKYQDCYDYFDSAIISVSHNMHYKIGMDLIKIEKPLAPTLEECNELILNAEKSNVVLSVGLFRRNLLGLIRLKEMLDKGLLGNIKSVYVEEGGEYAWPVTSDSFWKKEKAHGGVLFDTGAHTIDLIIWLLGKIELIAYKDDSYGGVEADCIISAINKEAININVKLSRIRPLDNCIKFVTDIGVFIFSIVHNSCIFSSPNKVAIEKYYNYGMKSQTISDLFVLQFKNWMDSINAKGSEIVTGNEALNSIEFINLCYENREAIKYQWI